MKGFLAILVLAAFVSSMVMVEQADAFIPKKHIPKVTIKHPIIKHKTTPYSPKKHIINGLKKIISTKSTYKPVNHAKVVKSIQGNFKKII
jgi:hypothetical protein